MKSKSFFPVVTDVYRANNKASAFIKQFNDLAGAGSTPRIFVKFDKERNGYYFEPNEDFCYHHKNSPWQALIEWESKNLPSGRIKLIRDILGVEVYLDEKNIEWLALPNGDLVLNK